MGPEQRIEISNADDLAQRYRWARGRQLPPERGTAVPRGANAAVEGTGTAPPMTRVRPGWNQLDRRHTLIPKAYCVNAHDFGVRDGAAFHIPPHGDAVCAALARVQHELARRWHAAGLDGSGSEAARDFGFSSSTFSRTLLGERWMGERVMAAVVCRLLGLST